MKSVRKTIRGSAEIGSSLSREGDFHASWPLSSLSISTDSLIFCIWPTKYIFERASIKCLAKKGSSSLMIIHTNPAYCKIVIFTPLSFSELESILHKNGYQLSTEEPNYSELEAIKYSNVSANWHPIMIFIYVSSLIGILFWIWQEMSG